MESEISKSKFRVVVDSGWDQPVVTPPLTADNFVATSGNVQALFGRKVDEFYFSQLQSDWTQLLTHVNSLAAQADAPLTDGSPKPKFQLQEIDVNIAVTAEGHLAFIASASASASIQLNFKRHP